MSGASGATATERVRAALARIAQVDRPEVFIDLRPDDDLLADAARVDERVAAGEHLPLAGLVAAVKGNIAVAGLPTTAGCPSFADGPAPADATAVARLRDAGAVVLGTTNLDQFATGLVGTRSPYGAVRHATAPDRISGGSSSGSAVAVALGIADLALGTDTAGSGRVPAALHGLVGVKPTRGLVPVTGVVPACRTLDCVSVFADTVALAERVLGVLAGPDGTDPLARTGAAVAVTTGPGVVGVPDTAALGALAPGWATAFERAATDLRAAGVRTVPVDIDPLLAAARLLYDGAFVAERYAAVGTFVSTHPDAVDPVVGGIIRAAGELPAHRYFTDLETLDELRLAAARRLAGLDAVLLPTTTQHPTLAAVRADPVRVNSDLGRFTNFANLLDLAAVAVPAGEVDGLPFGVQLCGPAFSDARLAGLGRLLTGEPAGDRPVRGTGAATVPLAVVGAHLRGQPLNGELTGRGGTFVGTTTTAPEYRLHALSTTPAKPGLERVEQGGSRIEVEVWALPPAGFAELVAALPHPMAIGPVRLADGATVSGFLCEPLALHDARDITTTGGWRRHLAGLAGADPAGAA
ncbi:allophanate hydrolase [uncultured Cellulomonas sp.]|uniref:allophanate hydrolase n=1 Tax=uncultured Cellulomonas sp. TaxID=189682 RepID=UPI0026228D72|nr:allophanate hydrolase [uncultured Cellulomonas sp.]